MSAIATQQMGWSDASQLTERIRITAHNYAEAREKLQSYVAEAKAGSAHLTLGYTSWTAYLSDVLGEEPMRLARGERQEMVQMLSAEGMSTRAIAPIVGASFKTVANDVSAGVQNYTPESAAQVQGMDGKTYARHEPDLIAPPAPKRRPITDQAADAGWEIRKATEKLQRIFEDDRLGRNKEEVAAHLRGHLKFTVEACQGLLDIINN